MLVPLMAQGVSIWFLGLTLMARFLVFPRLPLHPRFVSMTITEILIWEATNVLLLIPVVIALVILTRWIRRRPLFTDRDWLFLTGRQGRKSSRFTSGLDSRLSGSLLWS
jgi:hypothetical protein